MFSINNIDFCKVFISAVRATLGEISSKMRQISLSKKNDTLTVEVFFDGPISTEDKESVQIIETELFVDFENTYKIKTKAIRLDAPEQLPKNGITIYLRRE